MGNQLATGLKAVGAKAASALPGLIGAIVNFLFKTAGQAIGYLAKHTWLLILAAVVFIFEKYIKKTALTHCHKYQSNNPDYANNYGGFVYFMLWGLSFWRPICLSFQRLICLSFRLRALCRHCGFVYQV